jgi:hypothetical protein
MSVQRGFENAISNLLREQFVTPLVPPVEFLYTKTECHSGCLERTSRKVPATKSNAPLSLVRRFEDQDSVRNFMTLGAIAFDWARRFKKPGIHTLKQSLILANTLRHASPLNIQQL